MLKSSLSLLLSVFAVTVASATTCSTLVTAVTYKTKTTTEHVRVTPYTATSYVFLSGTPNVTSSPDTSTPYPTVSATTITNAAAAAGSSAASNKGPTCPGARTSYKTSTLTSTVTSTATLHPRATTRTAYPCATLVDYAGPAYGDYNETDPNADLGLYNAVYNVEDTPEGASAQACCNACFFELKNCVQAYWYFYVGCVVQQAGNESSATGHHRSHTCPAGVFAGLEYGPDIAPRQRSTGNIAGPCGDKYTNF